MPDRAPHHRLAVNATLGALHLDVGIELRAPWTVLFGPSGSGKSSILRALCGLLPEAQVSFERLRASAPQELGTRAPNHRALGYAPQDAAIFPHLSVRDNVRFPSHICRESPRNSTIVEDAIALFRLHALTTRRPAELSGGERQRVSLARAFATPHARLLLLDEPFSGFDRKLRDDLLPLMRAHLAARDLPCLSVTHDADEALLLDADVIRIDSGCVVAQGPAHEVLAPDRDLLLKALQPQKP